MEREIEQQQLLYQQWPGNNRFIFDGRIMMGPTSDLPSNLCVWFILLILPIPFFILTWNFTWNLSPALPLLTIFLILITIIFLILTTITEPGIIPRRSIQLQIQMNWCLEQQNEELKFCETCQIYRPPRSSHCRLCDNCVLVYDHHCPFVNNCVGKRNYRYFFSFLISIFATGLTVSINMLLWFTSLNNQVQPNNKVLAYVFMVPVVLLSVLVLLFVGFHIFLRVTGRTTRENLRNLSKSTEEDFDWLGLTDSRLELRSRI